MSGFRNERLLELRRERGWSQMKLAAAADVTNGTVHRVEAGKTAGIYDTARKLAHALGVPVTELWEDDAPMGSTGDGPPAWASDLVDQCTSRQLELLEGMARLQQQLEQLADQCSAG